MASISFEKAIEIALEQHRAGHYERAQQLYMEILRQDPGNVDAIHLLGVLAHQGKRSDLAVQLIERAISRRPDVAVFHYNLAEALAKLERTEEAVASYRKAIELNPDYPEALTNLGNVLNARSRFEEAEGLLRSAVELVPDDAGPWNNLGNAQRGMSKLEEAIESYRRALKLRPDFPECLMNLGVCYLSAGRLDEAVSAFQEAVRVKPADAELHFRLGFSLLHSRRFEEAIRSLETAVSLNAKHADAHNAMGAAFRALMMPDRAVDAFKKAIEINPASAELKANLAAALNEKGERAAALETVDESLAAGPLAGSYFLRALILREMGRIDDAIASMLKTQEMEPDFVPNLVALGWGYMERGELDKAMEVMRRSIELKPDAGTHSNVLMTVNYHPGYSPADLMAYHRSYAEHHEDRTKWRAHGNDRTPGRKLKIGYVSPDFRGHSVSFFLEPILAHHNHEEVEVTGYAHVASPDMQTYKLRSTIEHWREIEGRTPEQVAEMIRADGIDILVDLAGHTANNALPVFALKPAPVQINMIGFPVTTGLSAMDYRVSDRICDPPGYAEAFNSEKLLYMPQCFWVYGPPERAPEVGESPAGKNGHVRFISVNNFTKVTPEVLKVWAKIMARVPGSRMVLQTVGLSSAFVRQRVIDVFATEGVGEDRLDMRTSTPFDEYMRLIESCDIMLDPFPFNGGTTTCHSLWMGVPVVALAGRMHAGRMGLSMLSCIGLPELCGADEEEYVKIAVGLAGDLPRLGEIRRGMRERLKGSALLDGVRYTRNLEEAYRSVWREWCSSSR